MIFLRVILNSACWVSTLQPLPQVVCILCCEIGLYPVEQ